MNAFADAPQRPLWARLINRAGIAADAAGLRLAEPDLEQLMKRASANTGLRDFGDDSFRAPLQIYIDAIRADPHCSLIGRALAGVDILTLLETRLGVRDLERTRPEIFAREVVAPIFITGAARSGTSILHRLLGEDPRNRIPLIWEALRPCPPPAPALANDARVRRAERLMGLWTAIVPDYRKIHALGATEPSECGMLMNGSGISDQLAISHPAPAYHSLVFGAGADLHEAYAWHKKILQILQWQQPGRWVLKAPSHMRHIDTLFAVYPDARVVQTHRDPLKILPSVCSLLHAQLWMRSNRVDVAAVRAGFSGAGLLHTLDAFAAFRAGGSVAAERFYDVTYSDLMADAVATVAGIYAHFGMTFDAELAANINRCLRANPKDSRGRHDYSAEALGLDLEVERARFAAYRQRYGVVAEV